MVPRRGSMRMDFEGKGPDRDPHREAEIRNEFYATQARLRGARAIETLTVKGPEGDRHYLALIYAIGRPGAHAQVHKVVKKGKGYWLLKPSAEEMEDERFLKQYKEKIPYPLR